MRTTYVAFERCLNKEENEMTRRKSVFVVVIGMLALLGTAAWAGGQLSLLMETVDYGRLLGGKWVGDAGVCGSVVMNLNCGSSVENYYEGQRLVHDVCGGIDGQTWFRFSPKDVDTHNWYNGKTMNKTVMHNKTACIYSVTFDNVVVTPPFYPNRQPIPPHNRLVQGFEAQVMVMGQATGNDE